MNHEKKPTVALVGEQSIVNVDTYAGVVEGIADEDLEDNSGLEMEIQQATLNNLGEFENGAAKLLLATGGVAYSNTKFGTKTGADERTVIVAVIDQVRQALGIRQSPISWAMSSSEWAKLDDLRDSNGNPIEITTALGDVTRIVDNSYGVGEFHCWAKKFAKIRIYKSAQADWYKGLNVTGNGTAVTAVYSEWATDESSLRVRQRQVMYLTDTSVVVKGTIAGVLNAITPIIA
jgi:hypothetical protein